MKKRQAQSGDRGIIVTALGYAINASPGPTSQKTENTIKQMQLINTKL